MHVTARMDDAAIREMEHLRKLFPEEMRRVMQGLGYQLRRIMVDAVRRGGRPIGQHWPRLSQMHIYQRLSRIHRGMDAADPQMSLKALSQKRYGRLYRMTRSGRAQRREMADAMHRWRGSVRKGTLRSGGPLMRMIGSLRYKVDGDRAVDIGALFAGDATYLSAVQDGKAVNKAGQIVPRIITPRMRRFFWAAGVPLARHKTATATRKRQLVRPVFDKFRGAIYNFVRLRVEALVLGPYESRDATARKAGLMP